MKQIIYRHYNQRWHCWTVCIRLPLAVKQSIYM